MKTYAGIPIQNLWLLMLYASDFNLSQMRQAIAVLESHEQDLGLLAWFTALLEQYLLSVNAAYIQKNQALSQIRGKVDLKKTYQHDSLRQGKIYCQYADLSLNHPVHQYLLFSLHQLLKQKKTPLNARLVRCQMRLQQMGVSVLQHVNHPSQSIGVGSTQRQLQQLCCLAKLLLEFQIPTTDVGRELLQQPKMDDAHWLRRLFEKAVAGFYKKYLNTHWQVLHGVVLRWPQEVQHAAMPGMKSDVILKNTSGSCILIDTKFTQIFSQGYYKQRDLFKSQHLYQLYTYLRSQEYQGSRFQFSRGVLLYPSIGQTIREDIQLHNYQVGFYTLDLTQARCDIEQQLLEFIGASKRTDCDHISSLGTVPDRLA